MATVGDGVKIGAGLLLFKFLFSIGGCVAVVAVGLSLCSPGMKAVRAVKSESAEKAEKQLVPVEVPKNQVKYRKGCNLRSEPTTNSEKTGTGLVPAGVLFDVLEQKGKWRKLKVDDTEGWAGCAPD